jgi:RNA:NAD 2'-phosphotransferase (TPT1/KptA family)
VTVIIHVSASEERALEVARSVEEGEEVCLEIDPENNMEAALSEAERIRNQVEG